eukprot:349872-Rhodomonas_salina.1
MSASVGERADGSEDRGCGLRSGMCALCVSTVERWRVVRFREGHREGRVQCQCRVICEALLGL